MRFVIFSIFAVLWVVMWWWTYTCHIKLVCCPGYPERMEIDAVSLDIDETRPLLFRWSRAEPVVTPAFDGLRDSLLALLGDNTALQVTGYAFRDEQGVSTDLGEARARAIAALIAPGDSISVVTRGETASLSGDVRNELFEAAIFEVIHTASDTPEIPTTMTFRFGQNAASVIRDTAIDNYIDALVERLRVTGEMVVLTGHSANLGPATDNYELALERARTVSQLLEEAGIPADRIELRSLGEDAPEVPNDTAAGRQQNRRVVLEIIQPQ